MASIRVHLPSTAVESIDWGAIRSELHIVEAFSPAALAEAEKRAAMPLSPEGYVDATDIEFFTIDPPGSMDLDQAMSLDRSDNGYSVRYAIADVASFVAPGGPLDEETHLRGGTFYSPDKVVPLHPVVLSEGAASLLPGEIRPAVVWTLQLNTDAELVSARCIRSIVQSRRRLDYNGVQSAVDSDTDDIALKLLKDIGEKRQALAKARGAIDLPTPEQLVSETKDGARLAYRAAVPAERWNEQISLVTGFAAAKMMVDAKVGLLRTLPPADDESVSTLRRSATALGVVWAPDETPGAFISRLDPAVSAHAALLTLATKLLRGASYVAFDGEAPTASEHSGLASIYAHCTAPLRRLADRYVNEICVAVSAGEPVPDWVRTALPALPEVMSSADKRAHALERAIVDVAEAFVLKERIGERFDAVAVEVSSKGGVVEIKDPAVRAKCRDLRESDLGQRVTAELATVDMARRTVEFVAIRDDVGPEKPDVAQ